MAKAGLEAFTQQIAMELAGDHIRGNAIAPGIVETGVLDELVGSPEAVNETSDDAAWITSAIWDVDGGMGAGRS